jgi:rRNA biogenesis protein RRP5
VRQLGKGKSGGKRIDLSLKLSAVCAGIAPDALVDGAAVPACVESVEDHGYVLSFGIKGAPRGFLPRKNTGGAGTRQLHRGSLVDVVLTGDDTKGGKKGRKGGGTGVLTATSDAKRVAAHVTHESDPNPKP